MQINGATALVTVANRGLGRRLAEQLVARGAAKVYGAARRPEAVTTPGVTPIRLDITDPGSVTAAAAAVNDVTILNNAGMARSATLLDGSMDDIGAPMESHYDGTLAVTRAFAPRLRTNAPQARYSTSSPCCPGCTPACSAPTPPPKQHYGLKPTPSA